MGNFIKLSLPLWLLQIKVSINQNLSPSFQQYNSCSNGRLFPSRREISWPEIHHHSKDKALQNISIL